MIDTARARLSTIRQQAVQTARSLTGDVARSAQEALHRVDDFVKPVAGALTRSAQAINYAVKVPMERHAPLKFIAEHSNIASWFGSEWPGGLGADRQHYFATPELAKANITSRLDAANQAAEARGGAVTLFARQMALRMKDRYSFDHTEWNVWAQVPGEPEPRLIARLSSGPVAAGDFDEQAPYMVHVDPKTSAVRGVGKDQPITRAQLFAGVDALYAMNQNDARFGKNFVCHQGAAVFAKAAFGTAPEETVATINGADASWLLYGGLGTP